MNHEYKMKLVQSTRLNQFREDKSLNITSFREKGNQGTVTEKPFVLLPGLESV